MPEDLDAALRELRGLLVDGASPGSGLLRAVAAGRRRGAVPAARRAELRPVDLRAGRRLQLVEQRDAGPLTRNLTDAEVPAAVDALLAEPFGSWHVRTQTGTVQLRVTKRGQAQVHRDVTAPPAPAAPAAAPAAPAAGSTPAAGRGAAAPPRGHDRVKRHLVEPDDPLFAVLGADADKRRQVDAFLRLLQPALRRGQAAGLLPDPSRRPLRVVDLGCGNAYLTLAAHRWLAGQGPVRTVGVEQRTDLVERSAARARAAGLDGLRFTAGSIAGAQPDFGRDGGDPSGSVEEAEGPGEGRVDVVLALHACDTATDEALARAVRWRAPLLLAAPCCHHDVQRQLAGSAAPSPYGALVRHAILRERFADVLTDALRAALLRLLGYRVDVVEFVESRHTPRNVLLRAVRTGAAPTPAQVAEYRDLTAQWGVRPALAGMLAAELDAVLAPHR